MQNKQIDDDEYEYYEHWDGALPKLPPIKNNITDYHQEIQEIQDEEGNATKCGLPPPTESIDEDDDDEEDDNGNDKMNFFIKSRLREPSIKSTKTRITNSISQSRSTDDEDEIAFKN